jgi:hypothetical protein
VNTSARFVPSVRKIQPLHVRITHHSATAMKTHSVPLFLPRASNRGFALIVTLSLMILLTVIAVGLLSLSTVSLRSSSNSLDLAKARANARMALLLAIGDLQKQAGLDTRVTARADILDTSTNPKPNPVLGVWKSWEGTDHDVSNAFSQGRPISPEIVNPGKSYKDLKTPNQQSTRFLAWLTSDPITNAANPPSVAAATGKVMLVGPGSTGTLPANDSMKVYLQPTPVKEGTGTAAVTKGTYAWWIGGENQKARLSKPYLPGESPGLGSNIDKWAWAALSKSHAVANPTSFGLKPMTKSDQFDQVDNAISLKQTDLLPSGTTSSATSTTYFSDLSTVSTGLLTNTATGGWRKDLSLFTENYALLGSGDLPLYRTTPTQDNQCEIPPLVGTSTPAKSALYPWVDSVVASPSDKNGDNRAVVSWANLRDYTQLYTNFNPVGAASFAPNATITNSAANVYQFLHEVRIAPVLARIQWVFSHSAVFAGSGLYTPCLLITPVITIWNPYNVPISTPTYDLDFRFQTSMPVAFTYKIGSDPLLEPKGLIHYNAETTRGITDQSIFFRINRGGLSLAPGELKSFSPAVGPIATNSSSLPLILTPGYRVGGGLRFKIKDDSSGVTGSSSGGAVKDFVAATTIAVEASFDRASISANDFLGGGIPQIEMVVEIFAHTGAAGIAASNELYSYNMSFTPEVANKFYPPFGAGDLRSAPDLFSVSVAGSEIPFLTATFGNRMVSNSMQPAKGFVQTSPFVTYADFRYAPRRATFNQPRSRGVNHPINAPYDLSFRAVDAAGSNLPDSSGAGFSGVTAANGITRSIVAEIPSRPLASLAELQHWDLRCENTSPPFAINLIGNSDASPLLPKNGVVWTTRASDSGSGPSDANNMGNRQFDDSYCANHVLFDDWFFSSISKGNPIGFGSAGGSLSDSFTGFVTGDRPLANRSYKPLLEDLAAAAAGSTSTLFNTKVNTATSWRNIASRIEVEGMFNVNSTSVKAWEALLSHAQGQKVPYYGASAALSLSVASENNVFSRFSIAADNKVGSTGASGFGDSSKIMGYRTLTDTQISAFATEIVKQVRLRGPFLSLSEFVNRQLTSTNDDLAIAGTIQAALNQLEKPASGNLYEDFKNTLTGTNTVAVKKPLTASTGGVYALHGPEYAFEEAAVGSSHYGMPGWTRQADVLRPLAPILSARDDTFMIRTYGDSRDAQGVIQAQAVCEVIVRRTRDYVNPIEAADKAEPSSDPTNILYGRRFQIVSFRWLAPAEI